ncbi:hypothetical protein [Aliiroseovarius marinus]|uniref:hypothetical protein n=1 Tax=Aliiroseovarius marinus TaxID=2500159 RepID=UPI00105E8353|nr:hypothetical protein [Aliiroseovarius marinus]
MIVKFFENLEKSRWLPWVGTAPFIIAPLAIMYYGEMWRGIGFALFVVSIWLGIASGGFLARLISARMLSASPDTAKRLSGAGNVFGFLFLPPAVGHWTNTHLDTEIGLHPLGAHLLWACIASGVAYFITPQDFED